MGGGTSLLYAVRRTRVGLCAHSKSVERVRCVRFIREASVCVCDCHIRTEKLLKKLSTVRTGDPTPRRRRRASAPAGRGRAGARACGPARARRWTTLRLRARCGTPSTTARFGIIGNDAPFARGRAARPVPCPSRARRLRRTTAKAKGKKRTEAKSAVVEGRGGHVVVEPARHERRPHAPRWKPDEGASEYVRSCPARGEHRRPISSIDAGRAEVGTPSILSRICVHVGFCAPPPLVNTRASGDAPSSASAASPPPRRERCRGGCSGGMRRAPAAPAPAFPPPRRQAREALADRVRGERIVVVVGGAAAGSIVSERAASSSASNPCSRSTAQPAFEAPPTSQRSPSRCE